MMNRDKQQPTDSGAAFPVHPLVALVEQMRETIRDAEGSISKQTCSEWADGLAAILASPGPAKEPEDQ